jgi:hypothetical protein
VCVQVLVPLAYVIPSESSRGCLCTISEHDEFWGCLRQRTEVSGEEEVNQGGGSRHLKILMAIITNNPNWTQESDGRM